MIKIISPSFKIIVLAFLWLILIRSTVFSQPPPSAAVIKDQLNKHPDRDSTRVHLLNQLAFVSYYNEPVYSLRNAFEAQKIAESIGFTKGEAEAFRQIGLAFWAQADLGTAINYFLTGLKLAEANKHLQVQADILSNIGTAYNGLGNPSEALKFLLQSRALQQQLKNKWREASVMNNVGDAYMALKDFEKAKAAYTIALDYSIEQNYLLGISTNTRNLGNVFEQQGLYDVALSQYKKAASIADSIKDNRGIILCKKSLASVYIKTKYWAEAEKHITVALDVALKANLRAFIRDLYEMLARVKEERGDQLNAFRYFKLFAAYKDSVQNTKVLTDVAGQRLRFETEKKQTEIELLKKDTELQASQLSNRNYLLLFSMLSLLLAMSLLYVTIRGYKNIRVKNKLLFDQNAEILKQHEKLTQLNNELVTLNEEMRSQQEEVMAQRDELESKNVKIEQMHQRLLDVNENLENMVMERTTALEIQNKILLDYAFINAHKLRAPLASIMGLVNLLLRSNNEEDQRLLLTHLQSSTDQLDKVVRSINETIERGLNVHDDEANQ